MKLQTYFDKSKIKRIKRWCIENELSFSTVWRHLQTNRPVRRHNAHKISRATGGAVTVLELLDPEE